MEHTLWRYEIDARITRYLLPNGWYIERPDGKPYTLWEQTPDGAVQRGEFAHLKPAVLAGFPEGVRRVEEALVRIADAQDRTKTYVPAKWPLAAMPVADSKRTDTVVSANRSEAAKRAWITIRANRAAKQKGNNQ